MIIVMPMLSDFPALLSLSVSTPLLYLPQFLDWKPLKDNAFVQAVEEPAESPA